MKLKSSHIEICLQVIILHFIYVTWRSWRVRDEEGRGGTRRDEEGRGGTRRDEEGRGGTRRGEKWQEK